MEFKNLRGHKVNKIVSNKRIKWDQKSRSKFQNQVKDFLREFWENHVCYEEFPCAGTALSLDLVNLTRRIAIEVQGNQHQNFIPHFHGNDKFKYIDQIDRDTKKQEWCKMNDIKLVEIYPQNMPITKEWFLKEYEIEL